jgi:hypothetical protein
VPRGLLAAISSRRAGSSDEGQREIEVEDGCEALLEPLSLVIALVVDHGPPEDTRQTGLPPVEGGAPDAGIAAQPAAPLAAEEPKAREPIANRAPPHKLALRPRPTAERDAISAAAGVGFGIFPQEVPFVRISARLALMPASSGDEHVTVVAELGTELFLPQQISRADGTASIDGVAVHAAPCGFWRAGPRDIGVELCTGVWLRLLRARAEGSAASALDPRQFAVSGWSVGTTLYGPLGGPWSAFLSAQAWIPFLAPTLTLKSRSPDPAATPGAAGIGPFFNSTGMPTTPPAAPTFSTPQSGPLELYEMPILGGGVLAGIALAL